MSLLPAASHSQGPEFCPRCGGPMTAHSMSFFNTEEICLECKIDERQAPGFADARAVDDAAIKQGNYNFPGVGLSESDRAFLADLRARRRGG